VDDGDGTYDEPADFDLLKTPTDNQRTIKAVVLDGFGVPLAGRSVTFGSDIPNEVTFTPATPVLTNSKGEAFVTLTVSPSIITNLERVLNITAGADTDNNGTIDTASMITLFLEPVTVSSVAVTANPSVVPLNGISTIGATATLSTGGPAPDGSTVGFTTTCGTITPFAQTTDGVATASFTAPAVPPAGPCTVTATIGGVTGSTNVTVTTALIVQPSALTINGVIGGTATFTIYGGVAPYTVTSNNTAFPPNLSGNVFTVSVAPNTIPTSVSFTVRDSIGATAPATLTIAGGTALAVLPSAVTVDSNAPDTTVNFTIFGGVAPYSVFTNNLAFPPSTPTVAASGQTFSVIVPTGSASGTVTLTVRDTAGTIATAAIPIPVVPPQALKVIPTAQTIANPAINTSADYTVLGGKAPYTAFSNNPALVTVSVAGSTVTALVAGVPATDTTVTITIYDDLGSSVSATLILDVPPLIPLAVIPTTQTLSNPTAGVSTAQYQIIGGSGGYTAFSDTPGLVTVAVVGSVATATVQSVPTSDTTVGISIFDSAASSVKADLVLAVTSATPLSVTPEAITVTGIANPDSNTADDVTFHIAGGTGTYSMFSDNNAVIASAGDLAGNNFFVIDPDAVSSSTTVKLTVVDSAGATASANVTVTPATSSMAINPSSITVDVGTTITFNIIGGLHDYKVYTSDMTVLSLASNPQTVSTTSFTATAVAKGSATITVVDSDGKSATSSVTITAPPSPPSPATLTVAPPTASICEDDITCSAHTTVAVFTISGGVPPYTATSLTPSVIPNPITILPGGIFSITATANSIAADTPVTILVNDSASGGTFAIVTVIDQVP